MQNLTELPDLARSFKKLKISVDLENASLNTELGQKIHEYLREKRLMAAIGVVYDSYHKNYSITLETLSRKIIDEVVDFVEKR